MASWGIPTPAVNTSGPQPIIDLRLEEIRATQQDHFASTLKEVAKVRDALHVAILTASDQHLAELVLLGASLRDQLQRIEAAAKVRHEALSDRLTLVESTITDLSAHLWLHLWRSCWLWLKGVLRCR